MIVQVALAPTSLSDVQRQHVTLLQLRNFYKLF